MYDQQNGLDLCKFICDLRCNQQMQLSNEKDDQQIDVNVDVDK